MWALSNRTPYAAERNWTRDKDGKHVWIVAVKATFDIAPNGTLKLADEQVPPVLAPELSADAVTFLSGTGGYILQARPYNIEAYDYIFAKARRYWGLEAWNLDRTVEQTLHGYQCASWLTLIGNRLLDKLGRPPPFDELAPLRTATAEGFVFRSRDVPDFIDRNYAAPYPGERAVAHALKPLQIRKHAPFGGDRWDETKHARVVEAV